jgi:hypothetical protein
MIIPNMPEVQQGNHRSVKKERKKRQDISRQIPAKNTKRKTVNR